MLWYIVGNIFVKYWGVYKYFFFNFMLKLKELRNEDYVVNMVYVNVFSFE